MTPVAQPYRLSMRDGVTLACAMLAREGRRQGWTYVIFKGHPATDSGLRIKTNSSDVDILSVEADRQAIANYLESLGWAPRPMDNHDNGFPIHGTGYFHPQWPCDIDIHEYMPGCDRPTDEVVTALTAAGATAPMGNELVPVPGLAGHTVVLATSVLRTEDAEVGQRMLKDLSERAARLADGEDVLRMAQATGSLGAIHSFMRMTYPDVDLGEVPLPTREWVLRTTARSSAAIRLVTLLEAPWRDKPLMLYRAVLPSRAAMANKDLRLLEVSRRDVWRQRWERLTSAVRSLPSIVSEVRAYRRSHWTH